MISLVDVPPFVLLFLGILTLALYYSIPGRMQNVLLLLVSYGLILLWDRQFALLLFLITLFHYLYGPWLYKKRQKQLLFWGIMANVLVLLFFRSVDYFIPQFIRLLGTQDVVLDAGTIQILMPLGISFYTLQNISYLVDVYRGQISPIINFTSFALYLAYFPKLIAGPIEYARNFIPNLEKSRVIRNDDLVKSGILILTGLVRKLVIADSLSAAIPEELFKHPSYFSPLDLLGWLFVYAFVIYHDFAGYTNIVRGISGFFGIELSNNFSYPYFARSFSEFWTRWHITLSRWLRDYIYFPLSRTLSQSIPDRNNLLNLVLPPMVTMLASGLWHGLSWNMVVWGGLHGIYLVVERLLSLRRPVVSPEQKPLGRQLASMGVIFLFVSLAWVPFRMELPIAIEYWLSMLNITNLAMISKKLLVILLYLGFWIAVEWQFYYRKDEYLYIKVPKWAQAALFAGALVLIIIGFAGKSGQPFIYQGF